MKRLIFLITIGALLAINPSSFKEEIRLRTDDSEFSYFSFDSQNPLEFELSGDRRYKLILRGETSPEEKIEVKSYLDGRPLKTYYFGKELSRKTRLASNGKSVTKGYVIYFKIPKGKHTLKLEPKSPLMATLYQEPKIKVSISPLSFAAEDYLVIEDDEYDYYLTSPKEPAVFQLVGPLNITLFSRLSHFPEMRGMQNYSITIDDNGEKSNYHLESVPSETGSYRNHRNVIPGKANKTTIKLDEGEHMLKVWGENVAVKLYVPQDKLYNRK